MLKTTMLGLLAASAIASGCAKPAPAPTSGALIQDEKGGGGSGSGGSM